MASYDDCCKLISGINLNDLDGCVISISTNSSTETYLLCGEVKSGPTIGTINISAYAEFKIYVGCPSKAGVSVNWLRKYDCENNIVYFIKANNGQSFIAGDENGMVTILQGIDRSYTTINANASSGPASIYMETTRREGYGLAYNGGPIGFFD